tara:strand:+ start:558 stop:1334 length:777 start_codon:yes stop_codon:yes gene_type:complete
MGYPPFISGRMSRGGSLAAATGAPSGAPYSNTASVDFDGSNDTCDLGFVMPAWTQATWSAWVKTTDTQGAIADGIDSGGNIPSTRGGIVWTSSKWYFHIGDGTYWSIKNTESCSAILDGDWHHVLITINGADQKIYVDGSLDAEWTAGEAGSTGTTMSYFQYGEVGTEDIHIGSWGGNYWWTDGKIDEVALFNSVLSTSDITAIYNSGVPASLSSYSPYGWWRMGDNDGSSGTTITDQGSGGNDGTLQNGPTFTTDVP